MEKIEQIYGEINDLIFEALAHVEFVPSYSLLIYGSSINGLAMSNNSDLDLSLVVHGLKKSTRKDIFGESFLDIYQIKTLLSTLKKYLDKQRFSI